jgi:hypothetical protein
MVNVDVEKIIGFVLNSVPIRNVLIRYGFTSADPYYWITDPDPALFFRGFQDVNKKK